MRLWYILFRTHIKSLPQLTSYHLPRLRGHVSKGTLFQTAPLKLPSLVRVAAALFATTRAAPGACAAMSSSGAPEGLSDGCRGAPLAPGAKLPIAGDESIMSQKGHGTSAGPVRAALRWGVDGKLADRICNFNRVRLGVSVPLSSVREAWGLSPQAISQDGLPAAPLPPVSTTRSTAATGSRRASSQRRAARARRRFLTPSRGGPCSSRLAGDHGRTLKRSRARTGGPPFATRR